MPVRLAAVLLAVALAVVGAGGPVQPHQPPSRVLVMPFAVDVDPDAPGGAGAALWLGEAAALLLADGLAARGVQPLARADRLAAFDRLDLPMSSALTRATMIRVGELLGASAIVFGEVHLADRLTIRARRIDVRAGAGGATVVEAAELADLFAGFDRVAAGLAAGAGPVTPVAEPGSSWSLEAFENYVKGLVASTPEAQQRFLESAMAQAPREGRILIELWRVYGTLGLPDRALEAASAVPPDTPVSRQARFALSLSLIELGRFDGASRELSALHEQRPSAALANAMGIVELRRAEGGTPVEAMRHFEEAVRLEPGTADYWFNLGYAAAQAGRADAALAALREVARLDAADAPSHVVMSALLAAAGRSAEARRERELAVWLGALPEADTVVASVAEGLERLPQEIDVDDAGPSPNVFGVGTVRSDERVTAAYHLERGTQLAEARRDRDAIAELRRAIYLDPYADEPHLLLGLVYQRGGRLAEAVDEFRIALWARETVEGQIALGRALLEAGDRELARRAAERALALDPTSLEARELLDRIGG